MKLEIHPKAVENFNQKIADLKTQLRFRTNPKVNRQVKINPNVHISGHFDETNIIGEIKFGSTDSEGNTSARMFHVRKKEIGLYNNDFKELLRIAENIQKSTNPKFIISVNRISEYIFEWIKQSYLGKIKDSPIDFILSECEKSIVKAEIWIPISELYIQNPFILGKITFKTITKEFMDNYENSKLSKLTKQEEIEKFRIYFNRNRSEMQNRAVAILKIEAERELAYELALEETERSLNVLRLYSPTNIFPKKTCYVAPMNKQQKDSNIYMVVKDEKVITHTSGISDKVAAPWFLSEADLDEYNKVGLGYLGGLLTKNDLTDFQQKLLEALSLYSKASLSKELSDRLLYTIVTLETIFIKDKNEPLQDNISLRMAQMHPVSVVERKEIIKNIKDAYGLRSSFVHHGKSVSINDLEILQIFMRNTWLSLIEVISFAAKNITLQGFFEELENRRVGG